MTDLESFMVIFAKSKHDFKLIHVYDEEKDLYHEKYIDIDYPKIRFVFSDREEKFLGFELRKD